SSRAPSTRGSPSRSATSRAISASRRAGSADARPRRWCATSPGSSITTAPRVRSSTSVPSAARSSPAHPRGPIMPPDLRGYFREEARELLEGLARGLLALERGDGGADEIARLFRFAHTLKGAARLVGRTTTAEIAHMMEDALAAHRDAGS